MYVSHFVRLHLICLPVKSFVDLLDAISYVSQLSLCIDKMDFVEAIVSALFRLNFNLTNILRFIFSIRFWAIIPVPNSV